VPSHSESFGLVAVEAQACGTPVVAAAVGGLRTAVAHEVSGLLVEGHDPSHFAAAITRIVAQPLLRSELSRGARMHAASFGWAATTAGLMSSYSAALSNARSGNRLAALSS
jgi:D-inositol-3-phosphate glycosyltransferase